VALRNLRLATVVHVARKVDNASLHLPQKFFVFAFRHLTFLLPGARLNWLNAYKTPPSQRKDLRPWEESRLAASKRARARAKRV